MLETWRNINRRTRWTAVVVTLVWFAAVIDWVWVGLLPDHTLLFAGAAIAMAIRLRIEYRRRHENLIRFWFTFTVAIPIFWQAGIYFSDWLEFGVLRGYVARVGLVTFFITGLIWVVWGIERISQRLEVERRKAFDLQATLRHEAPVRTKDKEPQAKTWNPLDPQAWYYGQKSPRLNQSLSSFVSYCLTFFLVCVILSQFRGCTQYYDLPAGGGVTETVQQVVKIQKIIRKKFVLNPFSAIYYNAPEIDEVKLDLSEVTAHQYNIGDGEGEGAGFSGGNNKGSVGFFRLEYAGGDWNQDFGIGGDMNMLIKYTELTGQKVAKQSKAVSPSQLQAFDKVRCPPLLYITGQNNISLGNNDIKILREYIFDKHGMIFGDNGGSRHFHNQFLAMMQRIVGDVEPIRIPADDDIHMKPYQIPKVPIVAPHGGVQALGWFKDGRWICYYHPGDIGDAWADGHAGVSAEIWNSSYRLGANIINYAHVGHSRWRIAQQKTTGEDE